MNKLLVTIYVPFLEEKYDAFIPINKKIYDILNLSINTINQLSNGNFRVDRQLNLYNKETGNIYDLNKFVSETDIVNGTNIVLL